MSGSDGPSALRLAVRRRQAAALLGCNLQQLAHTHAVVRSGSALAAASARVSPSPAGQARPTRLCEQRLNLRSELGA